MNRNRRERPLMAKPEGTIQREPEEARWGTWEELLLACAVNRYGTNSWDSVSTEIQKRSSSPSILHHLTPLHCHQKYLDLKRRYSSSSSSNNNPKDAVSGNYNDRTEIHTVPWLDELRNLRVAELKRELERYDLSIVSLQLKVKKLTEEREQSLKESENGEDKPDLVRCLGKAREEEGKEAEEEVAVPEKLSPVSVDDVNWDNQSVNESNSTEKRENHETAGVKEEQKPEPVLLTGGENTDPVDSKQVREDSCNGSSNGIKKEPVKAEPEELGDLPELGESVAESKGGGAGEDEGAKENSDMQSSASKFAKEEHDKMQCGSSSGDERDNEDQSPAIRGIMPVESQPLADFLKILQAQKLGSVFKRRLPSQETSKYRNLIRQHVDLKIIQTRLEEGWYLGCKDKFFRDLLLIVNNAMVFFGKKSSESAAAVELRQLVLKETVKRNVKSDLSSAKQSVAKQAPEPSDSLLLKPKIGGPLIFCRKRSAIAAKASASSLGADRKRDQRSKFTGEKPNLDLKQPGKSGNMEEHLVTKKRTRDRPASASRSSKKNGKNHNNSKPNKNSAASFSKNQGKGGGSLGELEPKSERNNPTSVDGKKQSGVNFVNRMKPGSSTSTGSLLDSLKSGTSLAADSNGKSANEQKKSETSKDDKRTDHVSRRSSGGRQAKEQGSPARKNVGRPPKRAAPLPSVSTTSGKRNREEGETEAAASRQPKRSRK